MSPQRLLSPLHRWLLLFAVLNTAAGGLATLAYTGFFLQKHAYGDSWKPMRRALAFIDRVPDGPLYEEVLLLWGVKFQYPPSSLLLLDGLRRIGGRAAIGSEALNTLSWVLVCATAALSALVYLRGLPQMSRGERAIGAALVVVFTLTFYPLMRGFYLGQIQTWITFLVALVIWLWMAERRGAAGAAVGLITLIKPQLGLLVLWGLLRRQWRFVGAWALTVGLGLALSLTVYGWANHVEYLRVLDYLSRHGEVFSANQSVNGLLNRLLYNGDSLQWQEHGFAPYHAWVFWGTVVSSLLLIGTALLPARGGAADLSVAILSCTMASPIAWEHHYGVMLPMFAAMVPLTLSAPGNRGRGIALLASSYFLSSHLFPFTNGFAGTPLNFLQSYLLFGAVLLLVELHRNR